MKADGINRRLKVLEGMHKDQVISTLADFILWCANHEDDDDEEVDLSPQMQEFFPRLRSHNSEKRPP